MCEKKDAIHEFYERKVQEIMQTPKSTLICVDETVDVTVVLMHLMHTDHVWVMDSTEPTQLLGVITESDTLGLLTPPSSTLQIFEKPDFHSLQFGKSVQAGEIMSKNPVTVFPDDTIRDVLLKMKEQKIKHLAVVDETRQIVGEISLRRLIQEYSTQRPGLVDEKNKK